MKKVIVILVLLVGGLVAYHYATQAGQEWLHGRWEYQQVAGDEGEDFMVFHPGGVVDFENNLGKYFSCKYFGRESTLSIECSVRGERREVVYDVSEDRQRLENREQTSVYNKVGS